MHLVNHSQITVAWFKSRLHTYNWSSPQMRIINIAPLFTQHQEEVIADLLNLKQECAVTDIAFMMPLLPEEKVPTMAKTQYLSKLFVEMKNRLENSGLRIGILVQSSMGHGSHTEAGFQRIVNSDGIETECICPLDSGFQKYLEDSMSLLANTEPDFLIIDDDFRLLHGRNGCFCDLHLSAFNKMMGGDFNRDSLLDVLKSTENKNCVVGEKWSALLSSSLVDASLKIRAGIDAVNAEIPCGFCTCSADINFALPIAHTLAGNTTPFVRINNARYLETEKGNKQFVKRMTYHTVFQVQALQGIDEIMSEPDTCPQNCYSTSATALHAHITASLLNGCNSLKIWITRLGEWEPTSGLKYREILKKYATYYQEILRIMSLVEWSGPATPLPEKPVFNWNPLLNEKQENIDSWAADVFGRLGIPASVGINDSSVLMLTGNEIDLFQNEELNQFLSKGLLLDVSAAEKMCRRGFAHHIGVDVEVTSETQGTECLNQHAVNGATRNKEISLSGTICRITPNSDKTEIASELIKRPWFQSPKGEIIGTGSTLFENEFGGRVAVVPVNVTSGGFGAFSILNELRKKQLIHMLEWLDQAPLPFVILNFADVYTKYGVIESEGQSSELLAIVNLGLDVLNELHLKVSKNAIKEITRLEADGSWTELSWNSESDYEIIVKTEVAVMVPMILQINTARKIL